MTETTSAAASAAAETAPEPEATFQYRVRLVMRVNAEEGQPETAVYEFIDLLTANGLRTWAYVVEDLTSNEIIGYFDGYGTPIQLEQAADSDPEVVMEIENTELPRDDVANDASLEALAQSLNNEG